MSDTAIEKKRETITEPRKRWRNWYRFSRAMFWNSGLTQPSGDNPAIGGPWPSKDVAEAKSAEWMARLKPHDVDAVEYLGAYPEGERP